MNFYTPFIALAVATCSMFSFNTPAEAGTVSCYGSDTYQSCTVSKWVNGEYVTCYGTITPYSEDWTCY